MDSVQVVHLSVVDVESRDVAQKLINEFEDSEQYPSDKVSICYFDAFCEFLDARIKEE